MRMVAAASISLLFVLAASGARAAEGVIEINQARALAGGVTVGDSPGFPVTLSTPGSYVLTSDLTVTGTSAHGIQVSADDISIDLGGFRIQGPVSCSGLGSAVTCSPSGAGIGIAANGRTRIRIERGTTRGFGGGGISTGNRARILAVNAESNATIGIVVGEGSQVSESSAYQNGSYGIFAYPDSVLSHNTSVSNYWTGIYGSSGASIVGNTAADNGADGISANAGSNVRENSVRLNEDDGIAAGSGAFVSDNSATSNAGDGIEVGAGATAHRNTSRENAGIGLRLGSQAGFRENVISSNTAGTTSGGVNLGDNACNGTTTCP